MEVWVSGQCVYAKLLADTGIQEIAKREPAKEKNTPQAAGLRRVCDTRD
jgi:hypothetical protein